MARQFHRRGSHTELIHDASQHFPWRLFLLLPVLALLGIPAFLLGTGAGRQVLPAVTKAFYNMSNAAPTVVPTPQPPFPTAFPQAGSLLYTVQAGDNCDEILTYKMRMIDAGAIFSDVKPQTVNALDTVIGQNCHALQPGMALSLIHNIRSSLLAALCSKSRPPRNSRSCPRH